MAVVSGRPRDPSRQRRLEGLWNRFMESPLGRSAFATYTLGKSHRRFSVASSAGADAVLRCSEGVVKQVESATFVDLIACERDCRNCSYAAALDCDGNCGICPHNTYCPCVNPVVARSKSALRLIELRPILLQDARGGRI
jgi:hypothetical protein